MLDKNSSQIETHPLNPFLPANAKLLFLGSFPPPQKRWCMDFFYPNFINDHWRIEGEVWFNNRNYFVDTEKKIFLKDKIIDFLQQKGIALYDTAEKVKRLKNNASDNFLEIVQATDVPNLLKQIPYCQAIATTGEKATTTICLQYNIDKIPNVGDNIWLNKHLKLYRLPSSSRAYPLSFDKKAAAYKKMFADIFDL